MKKLSTLRSNLRSRLLILSTIIFGIIFISAFVPTTIDDFFLPGSQPGQSGNLEHPQKCDNCHGGYDLAVEPAHNWRGSMMAQAMRDPLFLACLAIANQDAPESGDMCIRCHSPSGWLEGRSVPTDGSALNNNDMEGVQCDFCHKLVKPTPLGVNPYPNDPDYTANTYEADQEYLATLSHIPPQDGNGSYVADKSNSKRGPFVDANAKHKMKYSPFHKESGICGTCHDVSNPVYQWDEVSGAYVPNALGTPSEIFDTYLLFPVERTYSEWMNSAYNTEQGVYNPQLGGNKQYVSTCQDCHMRDVTGYGCNKNGVPLRNDLPLHDMTGGNTFVPGLVAILFPDEVSIDALNDGVARARYMLQNAATLNVSCTDEGGGIYEVEVEVINETGHKLPSGYPEGRRIWINLKAYDDNNALAYESGAYDLNTAELSYDDDVKIYEIKPGIGSNVANPPDYPEGVSFHFAINNHIYFDNRIPPRGFTNAAFESIQSPPIGYSYADGQYNDITEYNISGGPLSRIEVILYYQTLSKEYVTFLRDENTTNTKGQEMYDLWEQNGKSAPEVMESVTIELSPPIADFTATPNAGYAPLEVQFTDLTTNGPTSWFWDFGGDGTSTDQNPIHTFVNQGTYLVELTVSNDFGSTTSTTTIDVDELTQTLIFVHDINVSRVTMGGNRKAGTCEVTIWNTDGNPVPGASVDVSYTGPNSGNKTASTNGSGVAAFQTKATKNANNVWCFTVEDVSLSGSIYDPSLNVETTDCEGTKSMDLLVDGESGNLDLTQIFPNPISSNATIAFDLMKDAEVEIQLVNLYGQVIERLIRGTYTEGSHKYSWNASQLTDGIYYIRITAGNEMIMRKVIKVK